MPMIEQFLRENFEPLQYLAFFGALGVFASLELVIPRQRCGLSRLQRWPANGLLTLLNIVVLSALPLTGLLVADVAQARGWGILNDPALPLTAAVCLGFVCRSLIAYLIHLAMHKVPLFWRLHAVHHSDTALDITTTVRFHPLELMVSVPLSLAATAMLGIPVLAVMLYELADAAMAVFTHSNLALPRRLERILQWLLVTPAMHRLHHSAWQPETDSNYGSILSLWDRIFATYRSRSEIEPEPRAIGLDTVPAARAHHLGSVLAHPFVRVAPSVPSDRNDACDIV